MHGLETKMNAQPCNVSYKILAPYSDHIITNILVKKSKLADPQKTGSILSQSLGRVVCNFQEREEENKSFQEKADGKRNWTHKYLGALF